MNYKKILITGSGTGLGYMVALELARRGHKIIATALYDEEVKKINEYAIKNNLDIKSFKLDITKEEDRNKILEYDFDVLINNAAIGDSGSICEIPIENFKNVFETNVYSNILITQTAFKKFVNKGIGRIIFISSLTGRVAMPFLAPYSSSKFAIEGMVEALRLETKLINDAKIDVCLIEPGAYATGFNSENNGKMYTWITENSYFYKNIAKIKKIQTKIWNLIESKNFKSIIKKYVRAVESKHLKFRYKAPLIQAIIVKLALLFK